ncbi:MAG: hypothetical protein ACREL7_12215 [Longimicrobiales bacterium]
MAIKYRPEWFTQLIAAVGGKAIGKAALASQPDVITPMESTDGPREAEAKAAVESLTRRGFAFVGSYVIPEMSGLPVHFLTRVEECVVAVVYEHPKAGVWCDLATRYLDGTSFTITNARMGGGLDARPGHETLRVPGLTTAALHIRLLRDRPKTTPVGIAPADVARVFADAYASEMAWRKGKGIKKQEVRTVAVEMEERPQES